MHTHFYVVHISDAMLKYLLVPKRAVLQERKDGSAADSSTFGVWSRDADELQTILAVARDSLQPSAAQQAGVEILGALRGELSTRAADRSQSLGARGSSDLRSVVRDALLDLAEDDEFLSRICDRVSQRMGNLSDPSLGSSHVSPSSASTPKAPLATSTPTVIPIPTATPPVAIPAT